MPGNIKEKRTGNPSAQLDKFVAHTLGGVMSDNVRNLMSQNSGQSILVLAKRQDSRVNEDLSTAPG